MALEEPTHEMYRVGTGKIWCCAVCGFAVQVVSGNKPVNRVCYGNFQAMINWLFTSIRNQVEPDMEEDDDEEPVPPPA